MIYAFANCVLFGAPFSGSKMYKGTSVSNMRTDGILRLLSGESFELHPEDKQTLFASDICRESRKKFEEEYPTASFEKNFTYQHIDPTADDVFLWTPFSDCFCSHTKARCSDGSVYPSMHWPISDVFEHLERVLFEQVIELWKQLIDRLSHVRKKGIVLYPPDHMKYESHRSHAFMRNEDACQLFLAHGWHVFSPLPVLQAGDDEWSHYNKESRQKLWEEIQSVFSL